MYTHVNRQVNLSTFRIKWDIMRNATNSEINVSVSHLTKKMYCERLMGNWYEFVGIDWSLGSVLGNYFFSSFWNCSAKWQVQAQTQHHELLQLFMIWCETRTVGAVKVFGWLIKFSSLLLTSVATLVSNTFADKNNPLLFWDKRKLTEFTASYLKKYNLSKTLVFT